MNTELRTLVRPGANLITAAGPDLRRRAWGDCMLGVLVPGAQSIEDCERAGWPRWFASTCMALYDSDTGATDELAAAAAWAARVEQVITVALDYERVGALFHQALLAAVHEIDPAADWEPERRTAFDKLRSSVATAEIPGALTSAAAAIAVAARQWLEGWGEARTAQREQLIEALMAVAEAADEDGRLDDPDALRLSGPTGPELRDLQERLEAAGASVVVVHDSGETHVQGRLFTVRGAANIRMFFGLSATEEPPRDSG